MKLFTKWKTVNRITGAKAQIGNIFSSYKTDIIILVQEKPKMFGDGIVYRCLGKSIGLTAKLDSDLVMYTLGIYSYEELKNFKN